MYLAQTIVNGQTRYCIRESYLHQSRFLSRNLFDLGIDPAQYIVYPGGNSFYIHASIEEQLNDLDVYPKDDELEDIFWRFVDPTIRRALETFRNRQKKLKHRKVPEARYGSLIKDPHLRSASNPLLTVWASESAEHCLRAA